MKNGKTKIADIAEALGISVISAGRALSGQSGVSEELRERVAGKAREMGYIKAKSNSDLNILVLHQKPYLQDSSNYSLKIQGIEGAIQKTGAAYDIEFVEKSKQESLTLPCKLSRKNCYDGLILIGDFIDEYIDLLKTKIKNLVLYTGYSPSCDYDSVWFNFNNGGYQQCAHLIQKGHRIIGFLGHSDEFKNHEKIHGVRAALEQHGLPVIHELFIYAEDNFEEKAMKLIERKPRPTAIICQWDYTAIQLIKLLYEKGIRVPEDLSVIGSGNTEMSTLSIPALTTLDLNIGYSCDRAVSLLIHRINNPEKPNENITINSKLVERDSVKAL